MLISGSSSNVLQQWFRNQQGLVAKGVDETRISLGQQHKDRMKHVSRIQETANGLSRRLKAGNTNTEAIRPPAAPRDGSPDGPSDGTQDGPSDGLPDGPVSERRMSSAREGMMSAMLADYMQTPLCAAFGPENQLELDWNLNCLFPVLPLLMGETIPGEHLLFWCDDTNANSCISEIDSMINLARENGSENCTELVGDFELMKTFCVKDRETGDYCWVDAPWPYAGKVPIAMAMMDEELTQETLVEFCSPCLFEMFNMIAETQSDDDMDENGVFETEADVLCAHEDGIYCMTLVDAFMEQPTGETWCNACFTRTFMPMIEMDVTDEELEKVGKAHKALCQTDENGVICIDRMLAEEEDSGEECFGPLYEPGTCPDACKTFLIETADALGCCASVWLHLDFSSLITDYCALDIPKGCKEKEDTRELEEEGEEVEAVSVNMELQIMEAQHDTAATLSATYVPITMVVVSVIISSLSI